MPGTSLNVQWLRLYAFTVGCVCLIPGLGTKILHAVAKKKKGKPCLVLFLQGAPYPICLQEPTANHGPPGRIHAQHSCHEPKNSWIVREHPPWCHALFWSQSLIHRFPALSSKFLIGCQPSGSAWVGRPAVWLGARRLF